MIVYNDRNKINIFKNTIAYLYNVDGVTTVQLIMLVKHHLFSLKASFLKKTRLILENPRLYPYNQSIWFWIILNTDATHWSKNLGNLKASPMPYAYGWLPTIDGNFGFLLWFNRICRLLIGTTSVLKGGCKLWIWIALVKPYFERCRLGQWLCALSYFMRWQFDHHLKSVWVLLFFNGLFMHEMNVLSENQVSSKKANHLLHVNSLYSPTEAPRTLRIIKLRGSPNLPNECAYKKLQSMFNDQGWCVDLITVKNTT